MYATNLSISHSYFYLVNIILLIAEFEEGPISLIQDLVLFYSVLYLIINEFEQEPILLIKALSLFYSVK